MPNSTDITEDERETFIKKHWGISLGIIIACILLGFYLNLSFTDGSIVTQKITEIVNGTSVDRISYNFVYKHPWANIVANFLYAFAMAFAIALFILKMIQEDEEKLREKKALEREKRIHEEEKRYKKEIAENVFKGVFNRLMPQEIFDVLQNDIIKADVLRRNVRWVYDFSINESQNTILLKRNVTYEVHNLTNTEHIEEFSYTYSKTAYTSTKIISLKWHDKADKEATEVFYDTAEAVEHNLKHELKENTDKVYTEIKIPPNKDRLVNFVSEEKHTTGINFVRDTHFCSTCAIGWGLHVNFPKNYDFNIMSLFPGEVETVIADEGKKVYEYDGAILKGQGIEFVLCKKTS